MGFDFGFFFLEFRVGEGGYVGFVVVVGWFWFFVFTEFGLGERVFGFMVFLV